MNITEALDKILCSFKKYYNIKTGDQAEAPFAAEAEFISHNEQYFLIKRAKVADIDSNEYVYFYAADEVNHDTLQELDETAWNRGMARVTPGYSHRNSDVTLIIIADRLSPEVKAAVPQLKHYKSYMFMLHGWSHYRLIALELSTGDLVYNRQGQSLKKLVSNILK